MGTDEVEGEIHNHRDSDTELIALHNGSFSGPLNKRVGRRSAKLNVSNSTSAIDLNHQEQDEEKAEQDYVEVTMDIQGDSVALHSVKTVPGNNGEDEKLVLLGKGMEKKRSFGASFVRTASIRMKHVSQELKKLTSFSKQVGPQKVYDRTKSAASHALRGLKFINNKTDVGWFEVEKQFDILSTHDAFLHRSLFAKCIGQYRVFGVCVSVLFSMCLLNYPCFLDFLCRDEQGV